VSQLTQRYIVSEMHVSNILRKYLAVALVCSKLVYAQRTHWLNAKPKFLDKYAVIPVLAAWKTSSSDTERFGIGSTQVESDGTR